ADVADDEEHRRQAVERGVDERQIRDREAHRRLRGGKGSRSTVTRGRTSVTAVASKLHGLFRRNSGAVGDHQYPQQRQVDDRGKEQPARVTGRAGQRETYRYTEEEQRESQR